MAPDVRREFGHFPRRLKIWTSERCFQIISHECASCTLPYGLKPDYIMEPVPGIQFRSWSLDINVEAFAFLHGHDLDGISVVVPIRGLMSDSTNLGDTRISVRDEMCQEFSSKAREGQHLLTHSTANEKHSSMHWCRNLGVKCWMEGYSATNSSANAPTSESY